LIPEYNETDELIVGEIICKDINKLKESKNIIFHIHGGAFVILDYKLYRIFTAELSKQSDSPLIIFDYRKGRKHPFPYALYDTLQVYKWFINKYDLDASRITILGDSAGGNLVVSLMTILMFEQKGLNLDLLLKSNDIPDVILDDVRSVKGLILLSPWLDMKQKNESYFKNSESEQFLPPNWIPFAAKSYLDLMYDDPHYLASPDKIEEKIIKRFPKTLIHVSNNEMLLDDSVNFAKNGDHITLKIHDGLPHVFHVAGEFMKESKDGIKELADFIEKL
jgi:monoterpene epsilon-lactone hydrolase